MDGGWAWVVLVAAFLQFFVTSGGWRAGEGLHAAISPHTLSMHEQSRLVIDCPNLPNLPILVYLICLTLSKVTYM